MNKLDGFDDFLGKRTWSIWLLSCLTILAVQLYTLEYDPLIEQDEVQILEYGRSAWNPETDWGISWNVQKAIPVLSWSFLGNGLQELAYRVGQNSLLGPRLMSVLSGIFAATALLGWLLARKTPRSAALFISLAFLLDPIFNSVYRAGRIDGWAIAACLSACWLLCLAAEKSNGKSSNRVRVVFAGFLTGLSPFLWATAPMLFPLVLLEIYNLIKAKAHDEGKSLSRHLVVVTLFFFLGGLLAGLVLLGPVLLHWDEYWAGLITTIAIQSRASAIQNSTFDLMLVYDPLLLLATLVAIVVRREISLIIVFIVAYLIMVRTMVYLPRILYLLPYFAVILASAMTAVRDEASSSRRKVLMKFTLAALVAWNVGAVLIWRTLDAIPNQASNSSERVLSALNEAIGPGDFKVLLEAWEGYYAARDLGWKVYRAGSPIPYADYLEFIETLDYVIIRDSAHAGQTQIDEKDLKAIGFELKETIQFAHYQKELGTGDSRDNLPNATYPDLLIFTKVK